MAEATELQDRLAQLEKQLAAQQKINRVLMDRVERSVDGSGAAYSLFERNIVLQQSVEQRTRELERKNQELKHLFDTANEAQRALKESEERFRGLFEYSRDAIMLLDENGFIDCNTATLRMFGCTEKGDFISRHPGQLSPPRQPDGSDSIELSSYQMREALEKGSAFFAWEHTRVDNGSTFPAEVLLSRIETSDGALLQAVVRDVTDRMQTMEAITRAREEAEEANRAKSTFLANMSHELRTPLNAIIGYSEILQEECEDAGNDDLLPDIDKIRSAGKHLLSLINDILDLSKIEAGKMDLYVEEFDLRAEIASVVATVTPLVEKRGNRLEVQVGEGVALMRADVTKVRQALFNLLSNAAKFTEQGTIGLSVALEGERYRFTIRDTGIGLSAEQMERLFQSFSQADPSTTRKYGGTGLGLSITQHFCRMMGGHVEVASTAGEGSTFTIYLPVSIIQAMPQEQAVPAPADCRATVLAIDDDEVVLDLLVRQLSREGYRVITAANAVDGLQRARDERPDAITLDVMMPGSDGWSVLSALKADEELRTIPVIMLSMVGDRSMGYALGASHFLDKPINRNELLEVLQRFLPPERCCVLVVEDDAPTREMVRRTLEREGCRVMEAENGRVALNLVAEHGAPDIMLLDLMMPEMDGFELIEELRRHHDWAHIPTVVMTAKDMSEAERASLSGSVERILQKGGSTREEMLALVRKFVAHGARALREDAR